MRDKIRELLQIAEMTKNSDTSETSSVATAELAFQSTAETNDFFTLLKEKLFRLESWNSASRAMTFAGFDENGEEFHNQPLKVGDFIRITLPATGKDDWVKIINIDEAADEIILTVRPARNPTTHAPDETTTSHFFIADSTNNFCLEKENKIIRFYVIGLDEKSNTEDTKNILETVRNFATANIGYYTGFQKSEWQTFCEKFLEIKTRTS